MYNDINLLSVPSGGEVKKIALKVFGQVFTMEEIAAGIDEPSREKASNRPELDTTRTN